ncbi:enoyl-CoA hydratase-related protein [Fredinandcohnia humi]
MSKPLVTYEKRGFVSVITIDNPPLNILTDQLVHELDGVIDDVLSDQGCRAIVLTATGEKAFMAGADITQFDSLTPEAGRELVEKGKVVFNKLENASMPVICAMNGLALGGGLELALACDIRIADKKAKMGLPETGLGILPGYGGTQRLTRLIGPGKTKELIFTGAILTADEAYQYGLIEKVVENGESRQAALALAEKIATKAPVAITVAKATIHQGMDVSLEEGQDIETNAFMKLCETSDIQEGFQAFMEKRTPNFTGK